MTTTIEALKPAAGTTTWGHIATELRRANHTIVAANQVAEWAHVDDTDWQDFADYWNRLTQDRFMNDGGTYRKRRYGQFETQGGGVWHQLPHAHYQQPAYINTLNGGFAREFDPLEVGFAEHCVLRNVLNLMVDVIHRAEGTRSAWNVKLHPYRIVATPGAAGQPTPEGLHRDGVDYIVVMLVKRSNMVGGKSYLTDASRQPVASVTLSQPMQLILMNDEKMMHQVSPVASADPLNPSYRDVLVIAFTRIEHD